MKALLGHLIIQKHHYAQNLGIIMFLIHDKRFKSKMFPILCALTLSHLFG